MDACEKRNVKLHSPRDKGIPGVSLSNVIFKIFTRRATEDSLEWRMAEEIEEVVSYVTEHDGRRPSHSTP